MAGRIVQDGTSRSAALLASLGLALLLGLLSIPLVLVVIREGLGLAGATVIAELAVLGLFGVFVGVRQWPLWYACDVLIAGWLAAFRGLRRQGDDPLPRRVRWLVAGLTLLGLALAADFVFSGKPLQIERWLTGVIDARDPLPRLWVALGAVRAAQVFALLCVVPRLCFRSPQAWMLTVVLAAVTIVLSVVTVAWLPLRSAAELWPGEFLTPLGLVKWAVAPGTDRKSVV
jgi:hypothetical protein